MEPGHEASAAQRLAERVAAALYERDRASQALGMAIVAMRPGFARLTMKVRADMLNGHELCHGGLLFTLADSAFAFACNSYNESTVAAAGAIDFLQGARLGDELTAEARELWRSRRNGLYEIVICNQHGERVALFRGRSYRIEGQVLPPE
ncbi:MAG TPA: hydroxyphenylacetyl-CoA thioesterase PaaI [Steroidobacteraceae bacterium]|nr:hydroxyphenylacetyl-CoA thioesterase PaaI [Steroidobacteraceae bacterium]